LGWIPDKTDKDRNLSLLMGLTIFASEGKFWSFQVVLLIAGCTGGRRSAAKTSQNGASASSGTILCQNGAWQPRGLAHEACAITNTRLQATVFQEHYWVNTDLTRHDLVINP